jgi:O-antigen/teichoic acid export membrane protein
MLFSVRLIYWLKILSKFVSLQLLIQVIGFTSGILIIRFLNKQEYAYYTIASTMQSAMNVLADSGLSSGVLALGGEVWQDRDRFSQLIRTAIGLKRYFAIIASLIISPILIWMLLNNGMALISAIAMAVVVLVGLNFQVATSLLSVVLRLHLQIDELQKTDLSVALLRLLLLGAISLIFLNANTAIFIGSLSFGLQFLFLRHLSGKYINTEAPINKLDRSRINKIVMVQIPNSIFYCIQGQITVLLISFFGHTNSVAEVGALSRLAMFFLIASSMMNSIVIPRFSRCQSPSRLRQLYVLIFGIYGIFYVVFLSTAVFFPNQLLWILGGQYINLQKELFLIIASATTQNFATILWNINRGKAWIDDSWLYIPLTIITQLLLLQWLDISDTRGAIVFGLISTIPTLLLAFYVAVKNLYIISSKP